jgi:uncharacterized protein
MGGPVVTEKRGFAAMDREKHLEICSKGGKAAHEQGRAHEFTRDEAVEAGRRGGAAVSADTEHMARIGRLGGSARSRRRAERAAAGDPPKEGA